MTPDAEPGALKGSMLGGYRLVDLLGAGGMAEVYRGVSPQGHQEVAVKVLPSHLATDPGYVARFRDEARRVAALKHPNVVPVFNYGDERGLLYITMPVLKESLRDRMDREGKIDPGQAARLTVQIASALDAAHNQGLVHRDVKPENILLNQDGRAMLTDFGIARELDVLRDGTAARTLAATGLPVGTPEYMAPEQLRGGAVDQRVDIYALGAVLYELLTGHVPHDAETPYEVAALVLTERALPPSEYNPAIWRELEDVVLGALATDPADRYATMRAFAGALRRAVLEHAPVGGEANAVAVGAEPTPLARTLATRRLGESPFEPSGTTAASLAAFGGGLSWQDDSPAHTLAKPARRPRQGVIVAVAVVLVLALITGGALAFVRMFDLSLSQRIGGLSIIPPVGTVDNSGTPGANATASVTGSATVTPAAGTPTATAIATATTSAQPTATPPTMPSVSVNPGATQMLAHYNRKNATDYCYVVETITNNSAVTVQWSWSNSPSNPPLTYIVNGNNSSSPPSGAMAAGSYTSVRVQTQNPDSGCSSGHVSVTISVTGGNAHQFTLTY